MAINISDFDKIWASTSPLTPYSFSDANYQQGWNFVGSTPPARQMWDSYFKWSDEKQQYIVNNFLPLAGGTMTGTIVAANGDDKFIVNSANDWYTQINGGTEQGNGAWLRLNGKTNPSIAGGFQVVANDGVNDVRLAGKPDGTLTWDGNDITPQTHTSNGTSSDVSVPNNTTTNLMSFQLTKGTWLVQVLAGFASNSSGYRAVGIGSNSTNLNIDRYKVIRVQAANGDNTNLQLTTIMGVASTTTFYINARQTSGSSLSTSSGYCIFRLSPIA